MSLLSLFNIDTLRQRAARMAIVQLTLTEQFNQEPTQPLTLQTWELVYSEALTRLPNNTIMNIISKARTEPYRQTVLALFQTSEKVEFRFERPDISFLYMNGVIDSDRVDGQTTLTVGSVNFFL